MIRLLLYLSTIIGANWAITTFGIVPVGLGLVAPAGVFFAGAAFTLRDLAQEATGRRAVLGAICVGAVLSAALSPALAVASGIAFLVSEGGRFRRLYALAGAVVVGGGAALEYRGLGTR